MTTLDTAAATGRWSARHPAEKAVLAFGLLACALLLPPWPGAVLAGGAAVAAALLVARVPARTFGRALRVPAAFVVVGALPLLLSVGTHGVAVADGGPAQAAAVVLRSLAAVCCLLLFAATTSLADLLPRLERLGVPPAVLQVAAVTYRLLFALVDTARAGHAARAGRLGHRTRRALLRSAAEQAATLLALVLDRARRLSDGLALRAEPGSLRVLVDDRRASPRFLVAAAAVPLAVAAATLAVLPVAPALS